MKAFLVALFVMKRDSTAGLAPSFAIFSIVIEELEVFLIVAGELGVSLALRAREAICWRSWEGLLDIMILSLVK